MDNENTAWQNQSLQSYQKDPNGGYHGYPISGKELEQKYSGVQKQVAQSLGITTKKLKKVPAPKNLNAKNKKGKRKKKC